jgi:glutamyl-tRNA synthetase
LLLGWNPGTDQEIFSLKEAAVAFALERINASPVALSFEKLDWFNGMYIRSLSTEDLAERCLPYLQQAGLLPDPCPAEQKQYLLMIVPLIRERLKTIPEVAEMTNYFFLDEIPAPGKEVLIPRKMNQEQSLQALEAALVVLGQVSEAFAESDLESALRGAAQSLGFQDGQVFMPLRVAISGRSATPGIFETLHVVGKERVLRRIGNAINILRA